MTKASWEKNTKNVPLVFFRQADRSYSLFLLTFSVECWIACYSNNSKIRIVGNDCAYAHRILLASVGRRRRKGDWRSECLQQLWLISISRNDTYTIRPHSSTLQTCGSNQAGSQRKRVDWEPAGLARSTPWNRWFTAVSKASHRRITNTVTV